MYKGLNARFSDALRKREMHPHWDSRVSRCCQQPWCNKRTKGICSGGWSSSRTWGLVKVVEYYIRRGAKGGEALHDRSETFNMTSLFHATCAIIDLIKGYSSTVTWKFIQTPGFRSHLINVRCRSLSIIIISSDCGANSSNNHNLTGIKTTSRRVRFFNTNIHLSYTSLL